MTTATHFVFLPPRLLGAKLVPVLASFHFLLACSAWNSLRFEPSITHHSTRPQFSQFFYTSVSLMVFDQPAYESNVLSLSKGYKNLCPHLYTFLSVGIRAIMLVRQIILRKEFNIIILETVQFGQLKDYQSNWSTVKFMMITLRPREEKNN